MIRSTLIIFRELVDINKACTKTLVHLLILLCELPINARTWTALKLLMSNRLMILTITKTLRNIYIYNKRPHFVQQIVQNSIYFLYLHYRSSVTPCSWSRHFETCCSCNKLCLSSVILKLVHLSVLLVLVVCWCTYMNSIDIWRSLRFRENTTEIWRLFVLYSELRKTLGLMAKTMMIPLPDGADPTHGSI